MELVEYQECEWRVNAWPMVTWVLYAGSLIGACLYSAHALTPTSSDWFHERTSLKYWLHMVSATWIGAAIVGASYNTRGTSVLCSQTGYYYILCQAIFWLVTCTSGIITVFGPKFYIVVKSPDEEISEDSIDYNDITLSGEIGRGAFGN